MNRKERTDWSSEENHLNKCEKFTSITNMVCRLLYSKKMYTNSIKLKFRYGKRKNYQDLGTNWTSY